MNARILSVCVLVALLPATRAHAQCSDDFILISTFDDFFSNLSTLDPVTKTATAYVDTTSSAARLRMFGERALALNFFGNSIQILDPCDDFGTIATGVHYGPRDVVFVSPTVGYVTRDFATSLLRIDANGVATGTVDLSMFADADGRPEMDQMWASAGRLYICLQRLNNGASTGSSLLAVLDIATGTLVDMVPEVGGIQGIGLILSKPDSEINFRVHDGVPMAFFSAVGASGVLDGGVLECVANDPAQQSVILTETEAGGDILDVEIVSDTKGFAIVRTSPSTEKLIAFDPSTGLKIGLAMFSTTNLDHFLTDIEPSSLGLLLADHNLFGEGGIRCFNMTTNTEIPGGPIDVGPAYDILVRQGLTTDAGETPVVTSLGQNYPNPFNPETSIPFSLTRDGHVTLRVYDVSGSFVATLLDENRDAGEHVALWNGRTDAGAVAPTGVYFVRFQSNGVTETRKIALLK